MYFEKHVILDENRITLNKWIDDKISIQSFYIHKVYRKES